MMELIICLLCFWLFWQVLRLSAGLAWGIAKVLAVVLMVAAFPVLVLCLLFAGGVLLLVPLAVLALAWGILRACL